MTTSTKVPRALLTLLALAASLLLFSSSTASAASPVARDGKIYACFKAKGKAKGDLRVVRSAKARCPRKWQKVAWQATSTPGPRGETGASGSSGSAGSNGQAGAAGTAGVDGADSSAAVVGLETKIAQLTLKVESLESILAGVTNADLLGAIGVVPTVSALCGQTEGLTGQVNALLGSLGGLNSLLDTLLVIFDPVGLPSALPTFTCPTS